jgi:hypothetical protein
MPTQTIDLNNPLPAAPAGMQNNEWQADPPSLDPTVIRKVSNYTPLATTGLPGSVKPDGVGIGVDVAGKIFLVGTPLFYKGAYSGSTLYNVGDIAVFNGEAWLCISQVDGSITPAPVQSKAEIGSNSITLDLDVTAGNLVAVYAASHSNIADPSTYALTDSLGTVYTGSAIGGGGGTFQNGGALFYGVPSVSGPCTITATGLVPHPAIAVIEFEGVTNIVDAQGSSVADSQSLTTSAGAMIVLGFSDNSTGDTFVGSSGATVAAQATTDRAIAIGYLAVGAAGTYTPGFTVTGGNAAPICVAAAFLDGAVSPDADTEHWLAMGTIMPTGSGREFLSTPADGSSGPAALRVIGASDLPLATTIAPGAVKPDGTTVTIAAGVISATVAAPTGTANKVYATPDGASGSASLRVLASADLPVGSTTQLGAVKADGVTIGAAAGVLSVQSMVIGFGIASGTTGASITPPGRLIAPRAGVITKCKVIVNTSDPATALTFDIKNNGVSVFSSARTVAAATAAGTLTSFTLSSSSIAVAADDIFTIDITSGTSSWNFTVQVE